MKKKKKTNNKTKEKTLSTGRNKKVKHKNVIEGGKIIWKRNENQREIIDSLKE